MFTTMASSMDLAENYVAKLVDYKNRKYLNRRFGKLSDKLMDALLETYDERIESHVLPNGKIRIVLILQPKKRY